MADDDIEVLIEDEPAPQPDPDEIGDPVIAKPEAKKPITDPEAGVDVLKKQLADQQAATAAANNRAAAAERTAVSAQTESQQKDIQSVETALTLLKERLDTAEGQLADAWAAQDFAAAAKLQRQISQDEAKKQKFEDGLEGLKKAPAPAAPAPTDPVELVAARLTPGSAVWLRSHPEYVVRTADGFTVDDRVARAHFSALSEGIVVDTPQYFAHVEGKLGQRPAAAPIADVPLSDTAVAVGGRTSTPPPAAPARGSGNAGSRTVRLTAEQVEAASLSGMSPQEYAKELERLKRENRIN